MQIVLDRSTIGTFVNSPGGTEALCRGCKSTDGGTEFPIFLARFRGIAAKPSKDNDVDGSHPGARAPGMELPALRA
ncbi:hypothetical protein LF1_37580 [Rubripirellula obstinata]|uniref:Uncharacterized protein n=1 Tax=Rubripirellula obstinata TaxID=406547 RepID=A0A5B1CLK8_9BACT|nr:hypothetical protein LF1_37580 [Rubripirellula obstinata]